MISIIEFIKGGVVNNLIKVGLNVILCDRGKGMTTFLIEYVNSLPHNKIIMFTTLNSESARLVKNRLTHPNCEVRLLHEHSFIGRQNDYVICDNFFKTENSMFIISWIYSCNNRKSSRFGISAFLR